MPEKPSPKLGFETLPLPRFSWWDRLPLRHRLHWQLAGRQRHYALLGGAAGLGLLFWVAIVGFFVPSNLTFSFAEPTCTFNPLPLPSLTAHQDNGRFDVSSQPSISLFGYPLFSHQTCVQLKSSPTPGETVSLKLAPLFNPILHKQISVKVESLPAPQPPEVLSQGISLSQPLTFRLDQADNIFAYSLKINEQQAICRVDGTDLACPLEGLSLKQGVGYDFILERQFGDEPASTAVSGSFTTLDPVMLTVSSIANGSTVFHKPNSAEMTFSKPLDSLASASLRQVEPAGQDIPVSYNLQETALLLSFESELPREARFELVLSGLLAADGSQPEPEPFTLGFATSGGPVVTSASVGSSKVSPSASIVLTFDSYLAAGQNFGNFVSFEAGGIAASVTANGNKLTINPDRDLPRCSDFSVNLKPGLVNEHGVGGGKAWSLKSRTICQQAFSIGKSVKGRSIMAYRFGGGSSSIVYVGGMHGNEKSSVATLNAWVDYLEAHARELPANRSIVVIPNHNPDGYASSRRTNANNVDLNRNFPSNDWATAVQMPGNQYLPNGGGLSPLDQPESAALATFIQNENPRLVLTYHAVAKVVISNDAGDSVALAQKYANDSGYPFTSNANSHGTFEYATTGEFEDWLADKETTPGILVELSSMSANQFSTHRQAMWNLATMQ